MKKKSLFLFIAFICALDGNSQYDSIFVGGIYRTYQLHLPTGYSGTADLPLVIAMHGGTGSGPQMSLQSLLNPKANAEDFIVVYPEGIANTSGGLRTWNAGWCCGYAVDTGVDDVEFLNALIDSLNIDLAIDLNRVYATGMSNGGFMAYRLACELSERIAAIAPVAASMGMDDCYPSIPVPVIAFNSFLDTNVPVNGGVGTGLSDHWNSPQDSVMSVWAANNGCDAAADTLQNDSEYLHIKWDNCNCGYSNEQYITQDGGHSWPGGVQFGDPVSTYIDATDLMWDFFLQYDLSCPLEIEENENPVLIYPNPANGHFTIRGIEMESVLIFDASGKLLLELELNYQNQVDISLDHFQTGLYIVQITISGGVISNQPLHVLN